MIVLNDGSAALLSCEEEVAASYRTFRPAAGQWSVPRPYQAPPAAAALDIAAAVALAAAPLSTAAISIEDDRAVGAEADAAAPDISRAARKRKCKRKQMPHEQNPRVRNAAFRQCRSPQTAATTAEHGLGEECMLPSLQEQESEQRHAALQPALAAAAAAVQTWLATNSAATVAEALQRHSDGTDGHTPHTTTSFLQPLSQQRSDAGSKVSEAKHAAQNQPPPGMQSGREADGCPADAAPADMSQAAAAAQAVSSEASSSPQSFENAPLVSYITLAAMKTMLRPKFCFLQAPGAC